MPCVDVGSSDRPFYFPAELCAIADNQFFRGELPAVDRSLSTVYHAKDSREVENFVSKTGNPFEGIQPDDFRFVFVTLDISSGPDASTPVRQQVWCKFQHEIGQRYDRKFAKTVKDSKRFIMQSTSTDEALAGITRWAGGLSGSKTTLIVAVNVGMTKEAMHAIKMRCETTIGVQVCFVNGKELEKRYHPVNTRDTVMYTGQIVRKILSKAKVPGQTDARDTAKKATKQDPPLTHGRLFGIHVMTIPDSANNIAGSKVPFEMENCYIATIVSESNATNTSSGSGDDLLTTHHAFRITDHTTSTFHNMLTKISDFIAQHTAGMTTEDFTQSVVYVSGVPNANEQDCKAFREAMVKTIIPVPARTPPPPESQPQAQGQSALPLRAFNLIMMSPRKDISIEDGENTITLTREIGGEGEKAKADPTGTSKPELNEHLCSDFNLHESALSPVFKRQGRSSEEKDHHVGSRVWHVVYQLSEEEQGGLFGAYLSCIEKRNLPDILYLAQAASKHARSRLLVKDSSQGPHECPYGITPVHAALARSLYYL